jgi:hypothetical protein
MIRIIPLFAKMDAWNVWLPIPVAFVRMAIFFFPIQMELPV